MAAISEGEVAVYDRQLRLWGVQAQQRLLRSKVLVWGLDGTNVEVCKNLVLAGVSLAVRDHRTVSLADTAFNYFLRQEDVGKNRAESAAPRIQEMNPLCSVTASAAALEGGDAAQLKEAVAGHDVVCASLAALGWDVGLALGLDAACREAGAALMLTVSAGELAFFFADLNEHVVEERSSQQGGQPAGNQPAKGPETVRFPSLAEFLAAAPSELLQRKVDTSVLFFALALAFLREAGSGKADAAAAEEFEAFCRDTAKCTPAVDGLASLQDGFRLLFIEPLVHVASVAGGLLAQEVVKAITKRDPPLANSVCFNSATGIGIVELVPAPAPASKKRKAEEAPVEAGDVLD